MNISPANAISDPKLLGHAFAGPSWDRWKAVLRAAYGEPLSASELVLFQEVAGREPPTRRVRELWVVAGRRSGKDSIASAIATVVSMGNYEAQLRPGEKASILCLAADRSQSKIVHKYILGLIESTPLLAPLIVRTTEDTIELSNKVEIVVSTNSFRALRGRSVVCVIFDEVAYWRSDESATPDAETYRAVEPALATFPNSMLIGISSPYRRAGLLFETWRRYYGTADPDTLVVHGATRLFNPTVPQILVDKALERDPEAGAAEWLAQWRTDLAAYVTREVIEACTVPNRHELPPAAKVRYACFLDAAGGSGSDSMTLCISHRDGEIAVMDAVREQKPPFSPDAVTAEFAELMKSYGVFRAESDKWGGAWVTEAFRKHGITVEPSAKPKSDLYKEALPLLNSGRVELLDHPKLATQFCQLERRTARGGRDSIDHPSGPGSHDDLVNAAVGALLMASTKRGVMRVSADALEIMRQRPAQRRFELDPRR